MLQRLSRGSVVAEVDPAAINDILQSILDGVYDCMDGTVDGVPANKFLSFGRPPNDCCDYLAIWFDYIQPTSEFPMVDSGPGGECASMRMLTVSMKLVRSCWPVIRDNPRNPFPPSVEIQAASEKLTIDANVLWCCLQSGLASGDLWPEGGSGCNSFRMLELKPDPPNGGCAGFTVRFSLELDGCCDG